MNQEECHRFSEVCGLDTSKDLSSGMSIEDYRAMVCELSEEQLHGMYHAGSTLLTSAIERGKFCEYLNAELETISEVLWPMDVV